MQQQFLLGRSYSKKLIFVVQMTYFFPQRLQQLGTPGATQRFFSLQLIILPSTQGCLQLKSQSFPSTPITNFET